MRRTGYVICERYQLHDPGPGIRNAPIGFRAIHNALKEADLLEIDGAPQARLRPWNGLSASTAMNDPPRQQGRLVESRQMPAVLHHKNLVGPARGLF